MTAVKNMLFGGVLRMNAVIYGAGKCGQYIYKEICGREHSQVNITGWIDNHKNPSEEALPVYKIREFLDNDEIRENTDAVLIAGMAWTTRQEMVLSLLAENYDKAIYIHDESLVDGELEVMDESGNLSSFFYAYEETKPVIPTIDFHVVRQCNLKCKGCSVLAPLAKEHSFADKDKFLRDFGKIQEKFQEVGVLNLVGGEPLLNPELAWFIKKSREMFPSALLNITTNGILIRQMGKELVDAMRSCDARLRLSQYQMPGDLLKKNIEFLRKCGLHYIITSPVDKYWVKNISRTNRDIQKSFYENCRARNIMGTCRTVHDGRLYPCSFPFIWYEQQDFLRIQVEKKDVYESSISLYEDAGGWEILARLTKPFSMCRYCGEIQSIPWSSGEQKPSDYLIGKDEEV